jgi:hypothetical protein
MVNDAVDQNAFTALKRLDVFLERDVAGIAAVCVGYHPMSDHCFLLSELSGPDVRSV